MDVLTQDEIDQLLFLISSGDSPTRVPSIFNSFSQKLAEYLTLLGRNRVKAEAPDFGDVINEKTISFIQDETVYVHFPLSNLHFLLLIENHTLIPFIESFSGIDAECISGITLKEVSAEMGVRSASIINILLDLNDEPEVKQLTQELFTSITWDKAIKFTFDAGASKKIDMTMYPSKETLKKIRNLEPDEDSSSKCPDIRYYDFKRQKLFSKIQVQNFNEIQKSFAQQLQQEWSILFKQRVSITLSSSDQIVLNDVIRSALVTSLYAEFTMNPFPGTVVVEIEAPVIYGILLNLLNSTDYSLYKNRNFTDLDRCILYPVIEKLIDKTGTAWESIYPIKPNLLRLRSYDNNQKSAATEEPVIISSFKIKIGDITGSMFISTLTRNFEVIKAKLQSSSYFPFINSNFFDISPINSTLIRFKKKVQFDCLSLNLTITDIPHLSSAFLTSDPYLEGSYNYESITKSTLKQVKDLRNSKTQTPTAKHLKKILSNIPLPLKIEFTEENITYDKYIAETAKAEYPIISAYKDRRGTLCIGKNILAEAVIKNNDEKFVIDIIEGTITASEDELTRILLNTTFKIAAEFGQKTMPISLITKLKHGSTIPFGTINNCIVDLYIENPRCKIALSEAVLIDDYSGIRISKTIPFEIENDYQENHYLQEPELNARLILGTAARTLSEILSFGESTIVKYDDLQEESISVLFNNGLKLNAEIVIDDANFAARIIDLESLKINILNEEKNTELEINKKNHVSNTELDAIPLFEYLSNIDPEVLSDILYEEQSQIKALVIPYLDVQKAVIVFENLSDDEKEIVTGLIAEQKFISSSVLHTISAALEQKISKYYLTRGSKQRGKTFLIDLIKKVSIKTEKTIMQFLDQEKGNLSEEIKNHVVVFDDILQMNDTAVQKLLRETDMNILQTALKTADTLIQDKIYNNVSIKCKNDIIQGMNLLGELTTEDVDKARKEITRIIYRLRILEEIEK